MGRNGDVDRLRSATWLTEQKNPLSRVFLFDSSGAEIGVESWCINGAAKPFV
jgi:hypothetical protein